MTMFIYAFVAVTVAIIASYFTFFENTKFKWGCIGKKDNDRVCFFALGQIAKGVIAIGQISIGVVTIGQLAVGLFCAIGQGAFSIFYVPLGNIMVGAYVGYGHIAFAAYRAVKTNVGFQPLRAVLYKEPIMKFKKFSCKCKAK